MKKFSIVSILIVSILSCTTNGGISMDENNDLEIIRNQFQRGRSETQIINSSKTFIIINNDTIVNNTSKSDWKKVNDLVHKIHLVDLDKLVVSSDAKTHQYDASSAVNITVKCNQNEYNSPTYDKGKAPKDIYELDKFLMSLSK